MATKKATKPVEPPRELTAEEKAERMQASADSWCEMFDKEVAKAVTELEAIDEARRSLGWKIADLSSTMQSVASYAEYVLHSQARGAAITSTYATERDHDAEEPIEEADRQLRAFGSMLVMMKKASEHRGNLEAARNALNSLNRYF